MRSIQSAGVVPAIIMAAALLAGAPPALAVQITAGIGAAQAGQTVDIDISTSDLTGLGVLSYQFTMTFNSSVVALTDVLEAGTITGAAGWGDATFNAATGTVSVSHAGTVALSGAGTLLTLRFLVQPPPTGSATALTWQSFLFNEGAPTDTTTNGFLTRTATPIITVSPNSGEILIGETLAFNATGSVTPPVAWMTTNAGVATIDPAGVLTGVSAGVVQVTATDNVGLMDTSNGDITVRAVRTTVGTDNAFQGQSGVVPVTVTDLTGLGIKSGQMRVAFNPALVTPTGVSTAGTLLDGYGNVFFAAATGELVVDFAGTTNLAGTGVLFYLLFDATALTYGTTALTINQALFNETMPSIRVNGSFTVSQLPVIVVNPNAVTLLAGQMQQFTVSGSPIPPISWSTLDPSVATIDAAGMLTAVAGGVTQVQAIDNVGATDLNLSVTVFDFQMSPQTIQGGPGDIVNIPIVLDRNVGALGIQSVQYTLNFSPTWLTGIAATPTGLMGAWGTPTSNPLPGKVIVAGAGTAALGAGTTLNHVSIQISPAATIPSDIPLTITGHLFNEGTPRAQVIAGTLQIRENVDVAPGGAVEFGMSQPRPNPAHGTVRFAYAIPESDPGRIELSIYSISGRRVKTLVAGTAEVGQHDVSWNLSDERGRRVAAGVYFARLEWGGRYVIQKVAVVR